MKHKAVRIALFAIEALMGFIMIGFELFEVAINDRHPDAIVPSSLSQQALMSILGLVIFGLASYLWMSEYRQHHFPTSPVSHA